MALSSRRNRARHPEQTTPSYQSMSARPQPMKARLGIVPLPAHLLAANLAVLGEPLSGGVDHRAGCAHAVRQESLKNALRDIAGLGKHNLQHGGVAPLELPLGPATFGSDRGP